MKIIIGLGNPEKKYELTRHNAGFMLVDKLQSQWEFPDFEFNKKFNAEISKNNLDLSLRAQRSNLEISNEIATSPTAPRNDDVLLVKPQTYMNLSGSSVKTILDFYKLSSDDILVIHDDIDIPLGKYKIATDSSSAGHNGVQNIIDQLGTQKFRRFRIGIGQEKEGALVCRLGVHDFVLEKFTPEELETIEKISEDILEEINKLIT
ncbi:MAG: Peptidyl-tRNA hydrolase [Candidatus Moranbacteria bacterium GW2011_GWF2_36_839]|nr:MAG: Peptidyl-tRNA hydrolase [Candidatus Moranbacteria bacterium GW2011_GWF1_36_78]KKQ17297.1 MAG: Peptidyl-tRNA hydrolase [Candidatus Moranbacteria bacterium GW2011_GWF2_36_839]